MVRGWLQRRGQHNISKKKYSIRFFRLETLRIATKNFSTYIGHGGFGSVFKGVLPDDDGRTVAIKRNTKPHEEFLGMAEFMFHARHINLIQVIGCCVEKGEQILVCEFADNGSISQHLHEKSTPAMDWERRAAVCIGLARGLCYLHEEMSQRVIHRDIKPSNTLLDANFVPKIADFDLLYTDGLDTTVKGTLGYLDPDYFRRGELTEKVDVYSFGMTVLEIVTGRRSVELNPQGPGDRMILNWATRMGKEGSVLEMVDSKLTDFAKDDAERFINVALLCTQTTPDLRPSMFEVVHMLYGRQRSDQQISEMALAAIAEQPEQWSITENYQSEFTDTSSVIGTDCAADMQPREESIVPIQYGECSSSNEVPSFSKEEVVRDYFEKSMEKIVTFHSRNQTTVKRSSSENMFTEAVYPPFLSGEYSRTSRVRYYSQRPA